MSVENARSCGFRKVGGLYLCGEGRAVSCDRLPYKLDICPTCGAGIHFSRAWTWLDWVEIAGEHNHALHTLNAGVHCTCQQSTCPMCYPQKPLQPYGLLWVGERFYSPEVFIKEALQLGISRRIPYTGELPRLPKNLKLGMTWVLFAHKHVIPADKSAKSGVGNTQPTASSAVFFMFKPARLELLIWKKDATSERLEELFEAGITPIVIPDGDKDHDPETPLGLSKEDKEDLETEMAFRDMKKKLHPGV